MLIEASPTAAISLGDRRDASTPFPQAFHPLLPRSGDPCAAGHRRLLSHRSDARPIYCRAIHRRAAADRNNLSTHTAVGDKRRRLRPDAAEQLSHTTDAQPGSEAAPEAGCILCCICLPRFASSHFFFLSLHAVCLQASVGVHGSFVLRWLRRRDSSIGRASPTSIAQQTSFCDRCLMESSLSTSRHQATGEPIDKRREANSTAACDAPEARSVAALHSLVDVALHATRALSCVRYPLPSLALRLELAIVIMKSNSRGRRGLMQAAHAQGADSIASKPQLAPGSAARN